MNKALKTMLRDWLPPAIIRQASRIKGISNRFEGDYRDWDEARARCDGYDAAAILDKVLASTLKVKRGEAAYERDSVTFDQIEYFWPVTSALMWAAARSRGRLNVLDFGGSLGSSYFQNLQFLQAIPDVSWNVVEQSHYVKAGRLHIQNEQLKFYVSVDECLEEQQPNIALLSSVMQYLQDPVEIVRQLSRSGSFCLVIDRTPFSKLDRDKILIQHVPASIYPASYPMWVFSMQNHLRSFEPVWRLVAEWHDPEGSTSSNQGLEFFFRGMLYELRQ